MFVLRSVCCVSRLLTCSAPPLARCNVLLDCCCWCVVFVSCCLLVSIGIGGIEYVVGVVAEVGWLVLAMLFLWLLLELTVVGV